MQFVFAIPLISMLLIFQLVSSQTCENANWWKSLDREGWSKCPQTNTYLKGLWRADYKKGDERVGRIEVGKCCQADESCYTLQTAICSNANWKTLLDRKDVWALCPHGYYMNGLRLGKGPPQFLKDIDEAKCCRPVSHPNGYEKCYDEDVSRSFDKKGWSECKKNGYYMIGFYKSGCNNIYCIEKFRCCKMKKARVAQCKISNWWRSLELKGWAKCPQPTTYLKGLWRNEKGDETVGLIERGLCCQESSCTLEPATCSNVNWKTLLDGNKVWALCPDGYYMNRLRLGKGPPQFLKDIDEARCCRPKSHPNSYEDCYAEDVSSSFDKKGWSYCKRHGYYMAGFYKSSCNKIYCIETFRCCKMKTELQADLETMGIA